MSKDDFTRGYLLAVANIMHLHGEDVIAADVLQECGAAASDIKRLELADYDAYPLRKLFHHLSGRRAARRRTTARAAIEEGEAVK